MDVDATWSVYDSVSILCVLRLAIVLTFESVVDSVQVTAWASLVFAITAKSKMVFEKPLMNVPSGSVWFHVPFIAAKRFL